MQLPAFMLRKAPAHGPSICRNGGRKIGFANRWIPLCGWLVASGLTIACVSRTDADEGLPPSALESIEQFTETWCLDCHHADDATAGLDLESLDFQGAAWNAPRFDATGWEKMLRRLETRQMPPALEERPTEDAYRSVVVSLRELLEQRDRAFPNPGTVPRMRRLTRQEYQNSIRDLLGIELDAQAWLPKDESSHGFDNLTVNQMSPTHLNRYLSAAQHISRAAIGGNGCGPVGVTIRQPADRTQEQHVAGLPFGTRGGLAFRHHVHRAGEYEIELKLTRDRDERIEGLRGAHPIDILVDRQRVHRFVVKPIKGEGDWEGNDDTLADAHLHTRIAMQPGMHTIGVTFPKTSSSLVESKRQPFDASFNRHRHPRRTPAIYQVSIVGPLKDDSPDHAAVEKTVDAQARTLVYGANFDPAHADRTTAATILSRIATRAYRRPVEQADMERLLPFFDAGNQQDGFDQGMERALAAILVNPNFLFRIETHQAPGEENVFPITDFELATRLSYFLWSSLPDERLIRLAAAGRLQDDTVLSGEVQRMLADERSRALVDNFASQWLYLKNLESITPNLRQFPDFDDNLRQAFREETLRLFHDVLRNDHSVLRLIQTDTTWLNERLATHYGIKEVKGSQFRPVKVSESSHRGGILRHGSILMVTSYATRTAPTIRGNWVLKNLLGTHIPPPPPNVPSLKEDVALDIQSVRDRLAAHRSNRACARCHDLMDPLGFAMEHFDAIGRWRTLDGPFPVDSVGQLPDGTAISSVTELESSILARPEVFVQTLTERLMTYALGRIVQPSDLPTIRRIVRQSAPGNAGQTETDSGSQETGYQLSSLVRGIVLSDPFRKRSDD